MSKLVSEPVLTEPASKIRLIVLQPTGFCNIDCKYCYLADRLTHKPMPLETLMSIRSWLVASGELFPRLTVSWHAGEPFVMPAAYFDQAFTEMSASALGVEHVRQCVQTNGTLVTDEHCKVLLKHKASVGISIDGTEAMHDANRVSRSGKGTHSQVMTGLRRMQDAGVPVSVISVIGHEALQDPDAFYFFFAENHIELVGLNVQEIEGVNSKSYISEHERRLEGWKKFLSRVFYLSCTDGRVGFRELVHNVGAVRSGKFQQRSAETTPFHILTFSASGDFTTFSPELLDQSTPAHGRLRQGNVKEISYSDLLLAPHYTKIRNEIAAGVKACSESCEYFGVCGGGAPANKLGEHGSFSATRTAYCEFCRIAEYDVLLDLFGTHPELVESIGQTKWWDHDIRQP
jgi:uncharacterized protein